MKGIKIKITAKFKASRHLHFEDTKSTVSPEMSLNNVATFKKRAPDNVTPVMKDLHWFYIGAHINFKTLCLMFKILNDFACHYLSSLLLTHQLVRLLHSSNGFLLQVPHVNTVTYGYRHFHIMHRKSVIVYLITSDTLNQFPLIFQATFETFSF